MKIFRRRADNQRGASLVEYGLLLTVFGAAVLASIQTLTDAVADETVVTADAIGGGPGTTLAPVTTTSDPTATTTTRPPNDAPVVYAGPDQTIELGDTVTQFGTVSDPNTPTDLLFVDWTVTNADGTANETLSGNDASIEAWWSTPGTYLIRLTASDGFLTTSDDAYITVNGLAGTTHHIDYLNTWGWWQDWWETWWTARVRIDIEDQTGSDVSGVTVTGQWNIPGESGSKSCVTNAWGRCYITVDDIHWTTRNATFTVTDVSDTGSSTWDEDPDDDTVWMW